MLSEEKNRKKRKKLKSDFVQVSAELGIVVKGNLSLIDQQKLELR